MIVQSIAEKFVKGLYDELAGLGLHDAVHVLATQYGLNKADLRAEIQRLYVEHIPADIEEPEDEIAEEDDNDIFDF